MPEKIRKINFGVFSARKIMKCRKSGKAEILYSCNYEELSPGGGEGQCVVCGGIIWF